MSENVNLETAAACLKHLVHIAKQSDADMLAYLIEMAERECIFELEKRKASRENTN